MKPIRQKNGDAVLVEFANGRVLFSYQTPVACSIWGAAGPNAAGQVDYKTDKFWSVTTSKHIGQAGYTHAKPVPQAWLDKLVAGIKLPRIKLP